MPIMLRDCISRNWGYIVIRCTEISAVFCKNRTNNSVGRKTGQKESTVPSLVYWMVFLSFYKCFR